MFFIVGWSSLKRRSVGRLEKRCTHCGAQAAHPLTHEYSVAYLMFIPFATSGHRYLEECTACGRKTDISGPPLGAPAIPFMQRFGAVFLVLGFFGAIPAALFIPALFKKRDQSLYTEKDGLRTSEKKVETDQAKVRAAELEGARVAFEDIVILKKQIGAEDEKCIDALLKIAPKPAARLKIPERKPRKGAVSAAIPFVATDASLYHRDNALLAKWACTTQLPEKLDRVKDATDVGPLGKYGPLDERRRDAEATLAIAKKHALPPIVGLVDGECDVRKRCHAEQMYFTIPKGEIVALARVTAIQGMEQGDAVLKRLGGELAKKVTAWK